MRDGAGGAAQHAGTTNRLAAEVQQLLHHFGSFWTISRAFVSSTPHPTRVVYYALPGAYADWLLIGAWDPSL